MFIELVDSLRCINPHEPTWLVAGTARIIDRDIVEGVLGCPICHAEYPVKRGIADFRGGGTAPPVSRSEGARDGAGRDTEMVARLGGLLDLVEPGGFVVLAGHQAAAARALATMLDGIRVLAVDAPGELASGDGVSLLRTSGQIPLRAGSARGIALGGAHAAPSYIESAAEALRAGGRLLAPLTAPMPASLVEIARDAREWLASREAAPPAVVPLRRADAPRGEGRRP